MKKLAIASIVCLAAIVFAQPSFGQFCDQDTLRAWLENDITNSQNTLHDQIFDRIVNSQTTLHDQLYDRIHNAELTIRAQLQNDIVNNRVTLREQLEAHIDDAVQTILDAITNECGGTGACPSPCADALNIEIEEALREGKRIAKFYLPAPAGDLALTRQIVVDTIAAVVASGESANLAASKLAGADTEIAAHRYKRAWSFLSQAYFEAIKIVGESQ